jgi:hypothetical protein
LFNVYFVEKTKLNQNITDIVQINIFLLTIDNTKQLAQVTMAIIIRPGLPVWQVCVYVYVYVYVYC